MKNESLKDPAAKKISESIDPADYNIRDPLDQDIRNYLVKNYNFIQCQLINGISYTFVCSLSDALEKKFMKFSV